MPNDRVQVFKQEKASQGGSAADESPYDGPALIHPQEDAIEAAGLYVQNLTDRDENVLIARDVSGNMTFQDQVVIGTKTLTDLLASGGNTIHTATFTVILDPDDDEADGTVTGLPSAPAKIIPTGVRFDSDDDDLFFVVRVVNLTSDGFDWLMTSVNDEEWSGPGTLTVTVDYIWDEV